MNKIEGEIDASWDVIVQGAIDRGLTQGQAPKQDRSRGRHAEILLAAVRVFAREGIARARL